MVAELRTYAAADVVLTVSDKEAAFVNDLTGQPDLAVAVPLTTSLPSQVPPFEARCGAVFVGNFRHAPNVDAAEFLCREVLPRMEEPPLAAQPIYIVGTGAAEHVGAAALAAEHVRVVGWVPDLEPYLRSVRVALVPLRHGAGVKGKLLEALAAGTPVVSTTIGAEGLDVRHGEHLLIADSPAAFAGQLRRLLQDEDLWTRLSKAGRALVEQRYSHAASRRRIVEAIDGVLATPPKTIRPAERGEDGYVGHLAFQEDQRLMPRIRELVARTIPATAIVAVLSEGRRARVSLDGRTAWHFPFPAGTLDARDAQAARFVAALQDIRARGAEFLVVPRPSIGQIEDVVFHDYAAAHGIETVCDEEPCRILSLNRSRPVARGPGRPTVSAEADPQTAPRVLVVGVCLTDHPNAADAIAAAFDDARWCRVSQRWAALGAAAPASRLGAVTVVAAQRRTPKFELVNRLLDGVDLAGYDYVLMTDDDIVVPAGFLDAFIAWQHRLDFAIAQPARTSSSFIDHPIVEQQRGVSARRTQFVEIGPVVSFHRAIFDLVIPFDLISPMGWGYENVWSHALSARNLRMGIIDDTPVEHSLRAPLAHYDWSTANEQREALLKARAHRPLDDCLRVLDVYQVSA